MRFTHYSEEYYDAVCRFLIELNRTDRTHINWNWARFEWMYFHPETDRGAFGSNGLWLEDGEVVGAAIYDMYFGEAFCGVLPGFEALYPEALAYARRNLRDGGGLAVAICGDNTHELAAARALGFTPTDGCENVMARELDNIPSSPLPGGLTLTEPDPVRDGEALQWLFWQGFDHGSDREEFLREGAETPPVRPHIDPQLGLAAADENGELASFCCLWLMPGTDYAYVEPVCTVPRHRGRGIARALLYEAMRRAREKGAKRAYVISDMDFYRRLGFEDCVRSVFLHAE